jgi:hypothetical protein
MCCSVCVVVVVSCVLGGVYVYIMCYVYMWLWVYMCFLCLSV